MASKKDPSAEIPGTTTRFKFGQDNRSAVFGPLIAVAVVVVIGCTASFTGAETGMAGVRAIRSNSLPLNQMPLPKPQALGNSGLWFACDQSLARDKPFG